MAAMGERATLATLGMGCAKDRDRDEAGAGRGS